MYCNCNNMDVEDELCLFFVRKKISLNSANERQYGAKYKQLNHFKENVYNYVPLMVKHIQTLNEDSWEDNSHIKINEKILFKYCLVYGKIMGKGKETKNAYSYLLDDGTGCIDINIFRRTKETEIIWKLENELEGVKTNMLAQNKNEIVKSLRNLLFQTKKQMDNSCIPNGCKVLVYGKPSHYRGRISLDTYHITQDGETGRDIEITFKDQLIDWYTKNVVRC